MVSLPAPARFGGPANRRGRRASVAIERAALAGAWPAWEVKNFPRGTVGRKGWTRDIVHAYSNGLYAVLVRYLDGGVEGRIHLAIRTPSSREPPWRDLQRIKNELFGEERFAVQVCPPQSQLIDAADMYHLWIMPTGHQADFGLHLD